MVKLYLMLGPVIAYQYQFNGTSVSESSLQTLDPAKVFKPEGYRTKVFPGLITPITLL